MSSSCSYADQTLSPHSNPRGRRADSVVSASQTEGLPTPDSSSFSASPVGISLPSTNDRTGFKYSTHWSNILNSTTNSQGNNRLESGPTAPENDSRIPEQSVLLFEACKQVTEEELLMCLPTRRESDSLVSFYFRAQEYRCKSKSEITVKCRPVANICFNSLDTPTRISENCEFNVLTRVCI